MAKVVGIKFKDAGKMYYFSPGNIKVNAGENVIVETARGIEFGKVTMEETEVSDSTLVAPLKSIIRVATPEDEKKHEANLAKKEEALRLCQEKIDAHGLEMKLIDVEYTFDNSKVVFYFTADGRVDFRELVKDLAAVFRMRIELRQSETAAEGFAVIPGSRTSSRYPSRWLKCRIFPSIRQRFPASAADSCAA